MADTRYGSNAELRLSVHGAFDVCTSTRISLGGNKRTPPRSGRENFGDGIYCTTCYTKSQRSMWFFAYDTQVSISDCSPLRCRLAWPTAWRWYEARFIWRFISLRLERDTVAIIFVDPSSLLWHDNKDRGIQERYFLNWTRYAAAEVKGSWKRLATSVHLCVGSYDNGKAR